MAHKLAVIIGAGASTDVIPPGDLHANEVQRSTYQPPITENIFKSNSQFQSILNAYPLAHNAINILKKQLNRDEGTIEQLLLRLKESKQEIQRRQFKQVPLVLQRMFGRISIGYCHSPVNYSELITTTLFDDVSEVLYLTLNYDLLLEKALTEESGLAFNTMTDYLPAHKKWNLVKIHGSVNWGRKFKEDAVVNKGGSLDDFLENLVNADLDKDLEEEFEIDNSYNNSPQHLSGLYPALTVPLDNKYAYNCPIEHLAAAKNFLSDCMILVIIGVSGRDKDLLELLQNNLPNGHFTVILVGKGSTEEAKKNFLSGVPKLKKATWQVFDEGFSEFLEDGELERLVSSFDG